MSASALEEKLETLRRIGDLIAQCSKCLDRDNVMHYRVGESVQKLAELAVSIVNGISFVETVDITKVPISNIPSIPKIDEDIPF